MIWFETVIIKNSAITIMLATYSNTVAGAKYDNQSEQKWASGGPALNLLWHHSTPLWLLANHSACDWYGQNSLTWLADKLYKMKMKD